MKLLLASLLLNTASALAAPAPASFDEAPLVTLAQPMTLFQKSDLTSDQLEVAPGQVLAIGEEANGFASAGLVEADGAVHTVGFLESAAMRSEAKFAPVNFRNHNPHHPHPL